MLHLPRQPPGAAVRKRRGVWGAASGRGGGEEPQAPPGLGPGACGPLDSAPSESRTGVSIGGPRVAFPSAEDWAVTTVVTLWWSTPLLNSQPQVHVCPSGWELGRHSGLGPPEQLRTSQRDQGPGRSAQLPLPHSGGLGSYPQAAG